MTLPVSEVATSVGASAGLGHVSLEGLYTTFKERLFGATEEVLMSLGEFQKELEVHINEITKLNFELEKENWDFVLEMYECERDLCHIRDYYRVIIADTKILVEYGSNQKGIPYIRDCIEEKRLTEAKEEIKDFLKYLQKLIKRVQDDLNKWQNFPGLDEMKSKIKENKASAHKVTESIKQEAGDIPQSKYKVFKLGMSAFCYTVAGAGILIASQAALDESQITKTLVSFGSEALVFQTNNVMRGMKSMMETSKLSDKLQNNIHDRVAAVNACLQGFFKRVNQFQEDITTIEITIDNLDLDIHGLQDDIDSGGQTDTNSAWLYRSKILQKMFKGFENLNPIVIEKQKSIEDEKGIEDIMAQLERIIKITSEGTPV